MDEFKLIANFSHKKSGKNNLSAFLGDRGDRIRTYDIQLPKLALYQAELHPERCFIGLLKKWLRTDSNRRHANFQSAALPTELLSLFNNALGERVRGYYT